MCDFMDVSLDELKIEDYNEVYGLWDKTPGMGLNEADSYENIVKFLQRNRGLSHVCRNEGKIIGTILCGHDGRRGFLYHVAVADEYRSRGIGRMLVENSLNRLKQEGIHKCHLFVKSENEIGKDFWNKSGWVKREDIAVYSKNI